MTTDNQIPASFNDPKNITVGNTRVIWARATEVHSEGWVLPGGQRTQNFAEAHAVAVRMDDLCSGVSA